MKNSTKTNKILLILALALPLVCITASLIGPVSVGSLFELEGINAEIYKMRWFRIALAIFAGAGLSVAGCILQAVVRNPLAEPYLLGISSGAGLGAVLSIVLGLDIALFGIEIFPLFSFIGAILTILLVYSLAKSGGRLPIQTLILAGIIVSAVFSSMLMFLVSANEAAKLHGIMWWLLGNLQLFDARLFVFVCALFMAGLVIAGFLSKELNIILLGEEEAMHLGINVERTKLILLFAASLITASVVSTCGIIGFVGLIVPHAMRMIVGPDHRKLIPASILGGGILLVVCDMVARVIIMPDEVPIGVITALVGGPFFIALLRKKKKIYFK